MTVLHEHDLVALTVDLLKDKLHAGDVGTIVHVHKGGVAYMVEFMTLAGVTIAVVELEASRLRPIDDHDMNHVRRVA